MKSGQNPRDVLRRHRERGPVRFWYSWSDISALTGYTVRTVQSHAHPRGKYPARFNPSSLDSVVAYILESRKRQGGSR